MSNNDRILLLGRDEHRLGEYRLVELADGQVAASLSVGSDPESPGLISKGDVEQPNEDALFAMDDGRHCLIAVADSHHGLVASHRLMELLNEAIDTPALSRAQLNTKVEFLIDEDVNPDERSECAFLIAVFDREDGVGFGLSWGDATLQVIAPGERPVRSNDHDDNWLSPLRPAELAAWRSKPFRFKAETGSLILAHTDGIDGCHYGSPRTSIDPCHLRDLMALTGPNPCTFTRRLTELALAGVDGHPGGQDNIATITVRV